MTPYLGQIMTVGFDFAPKAWAFCAGQTMSLQQNQALFAILGTTYGGNGIQTFQLPDLRGRVAIHWGQGAGQPDYVIGESGGLQSVTLLAGNLPGHTHIMQVNNGAGNTFSPSNNVLAKGPAISGTSATLYSTTAGSTMAASALTNAGSNQPVSVLQPYLTLNYCIALSGIFPTRN